VQKLGRALGGVPPLPPGCRDRQRVQEALTPNQYGVYEANVVIEGILKKGRSSFFPKDWTQEQVEKAILEAYGNGKSKPNLPWIIEGTSPDGMTIEIRTQGGRMRTAYPIYKGP
jgi:hypothetical protein